jgi:cobalt-zinc-cadmium resistance protein CzcA
VIGSEFLPHLDEGAIWARGSLAPSTGPDESRRIAQHARLIMASFPEVTDVVDQIGRPDDGTDWTGFFNTEYNVNLKPKEQWRPAFHQNKDELIAAINKELIKTPGVIWGFSQPIEDNMEEAVSGVKGELSVKIFGDDLRTLEAKGNEIVSVMSKIPGVADLGLFRIIGQPNMTFVVDRPACARWGINVADVQDAVQTAVGGNDVTELLQGEAQFDVVLRYQQQYRDTKEAIQRVRLLSPSGERVSLAQLTKMETSDGAEEIYREGESRYIAIKYSVRGRDLGSTVEEAIKKVHDDVKLPTGYHLDWAGEYKSKQRADARLAIVTPITILHHLPDPLHHVSLLQVGDTHHAERAAGSRRRLAGPLYHRHQLQRVGCDWHARVVWRVGADRRHHARVHQPAARARIHHKEMPRWKAPCSVCGPS